MQGQRRFHDHARPGARQQRDIADKLDAVAKALFRPDQNRAAGNRRTVPARPPLTHNGLMTRTGDKIAQAPPRLIGCETFGKITTRQQYQCQPPAGVGRLRRYLQGPLIQRARIVQFALVGADMPHADQGGDVVRCVLKCAAVTVLRRRQALAPPMDVADIDPTVDMLRRRVEHGPVFGQGLVEPPLP